MPTFVDAVIEAASMGGVRAAKALMLAAAAAVIVPSAALAQSASDAAPGQQSPGEKQGESGVTADNDASTDIVVTAFKREQTLSTVPQGISVVTGDQILTRGAKGLSDFVALTPGVSITSSGNRGSGTIEIRGITPLVVSQTVAIYVDEVPVSGGSRSGRYTPDLDPSDVERVEVLKGPQGTLYGSSSLGGVIRYVLRKPSLTKSELTTSEELNAVESGGDLGVTFRATGSTPLSDNLAVRVSGFYRHDPGFIDNIGPLAKRDVNDGDAWGVRGALYWQPTAELSVDLAASIQKSVSNGSSSVDLDWKTFKPLFGQDTVERWTPENFKVKNELYSATVTWNTDIGTFLSSSGYSRVIPHSQGDLTYNYVGAYGINYNTPASVIGQYDNKKFSQEFRFTSKRFGPIDVQAGAFYQHIDSDEATDYKFFKPSGVLDPAKVALGQNYVLSNFNEYAGFVNATLYLSDQLDFSAGYRHAWNDSEADGVRGGKLFGAPLLSLKTNIRSSSQANTYQLGARWRPNENLMFYARAASGYRPGGTRSLPPAAPVGTSPFFVSDDIWSYEAGVKVHTLGGRLTFDADVFRIDWSDIQTLVFFGAFSTTGNAGRARSQGAELQTSFEPVKGLILSANAAYDDAKYTEDAPQVFVVKGQLIPSVPKWTATADLGYNWKIGNNAHANIGGTYAYKSSMFDSFGEPYTIPGYATISLRGGVDLKNMGFSFYVNNLANKRAVVGTTQGYYTFFNPFVVTVNEPRTYGVRFTQKF